MLASFAKSTFQTFVETKFGVFFYMLKLYLLVNLCIFPKEIKINFGTSYTLKCICFSHIKLCVIQYPFTNFFSVSLP